MTTPALRTPVRIARGNRADIDAALSDIKTGEIVYIIDEESLNIKLDDGTLAEISGGGFPPSTPEPGDTELEPPVTGSGTEIDPFVLTPSNVGAGGNTTSLETVTFRNLTGGEYVVVTDKNSSANGTRFAQNAHLVPSNGVVETTFNFNDAPDTSVLPTTYTSSLVAGNVYFSWAVTVNDSSGSGGGDVPSSPDTGYYYTFNGSNSDNPINPAGVKFSWNNDRTGLGIGTETNLISYNANYTNTFIEGTSGDNHIVNVAFMGQGVYDLKLQSSPGPNNVKVIWCGSNSNTYYWGVINEDGTFQLYSQAGGGSQFTASGNAKPFPTGVTKWLKIRPLANEQGNSPHGVCALGDDGFAYTYFYCTSSGFVGSESFTPNTWHKIGFPAMFSDGGVLVDAVCSSRRQSAVCGAIALSSNGGLYFSSAAGVPGAPGNSSSANAPNGNGVLLLTNVVAISMGTAADYNVFYALKADGSAWVLTGNAVTRGWSALMPPARIGTGNHYISPPRGGYNYHILTSSGVPEGSNATTVPIPFDISNTGPIYKSDDYNNCYFRSWWYCTYCVSKKLY